MKVFRDTAAIRAAVTAFDDPSLGALIANRIDELSEYGDNLGDLVNIFVIEPGDSMPDIDSALGFSLVDRPVDAIDSHPVCYELTYVLGQDGFGLVVYMPKSPDIDPRLLEVAATAARERQT